MNKENKTLVTAIVIIALLAVITLNVENPAGQVTREFKETRVDISPEALSPGESLLITVHPGTDGINQKASFFQAEDNLRRYSISDICGSYKCTKQTSFNFVIPLSWENGIYYIQIYSYGTNSFVKKEFTVKSV